MALELMKGKLIKGGKDFSLTDEDYIGLYFSAHWCPPCCFFTPKLAEFYNKCKEAGEKFEIVFLSMDKDEESFKDYFANMPWAAVNYSDQQTKNAVIGMYSPPKIPRLYIIDKQGNTVTLEGREIVNQRLASGQVTSKNWKQ